MLPSRPKSKQQPGGRSRATARPYGRERRLRDVAPWEEKGRGYFGGCPSKLVYAIWRPVLWPADASATGARRHHLDACNVNAEC
jgi:hypothetical protein